MSKVSVIVVNYRSRDVLRRCLGHLAESHFDGTIEKIVVDNSPGDGAAEMLAEEFPDVVLVSPRINLGYGVGNNAGLEKATGEYCLVLNPDAFIPPDALQTGIDYLEAHPEVGIVGAQFKNENDEYFPSARTFLSAMDRAFILAGLTRRFPKNRLIGRVDNLRWDHSEPKAVDWVVGAFMLMPMKVMRQLEGFDPRFFLYCEEWDLCLRAKKAGWEVHYLPQIVVTHIAGASSRDIVATAKEIPKPLGLWNAFAQALFYRKHRGAFGLWKMMAVDSVFLRLSYWRNRLSRSEQRRRTADKLRRQLHERRVAMRVTRRGTVSPPAPWSLDITTYDA